MRLIRFLVFILPISAMASEIMPEMTRNRKTKSDALAGVAWANRNAAALEIVRGDQEQDEGTDKYDNKSMDFNPYAFFTKEQFSGEFSLTSGKQEIDYGPTEENKTTAIDLKSAYRLNEKVAALLGFSHSKTDFDGDDEIANRTLEVGGSYNHGNGMIAALSYQLNNAKSDDDAYGEHDVNYGTLKTGVGFQKWEDKDGYSVEAALSLTGNKSGSKDDSGDYKTIDGSKILSLNGLYAKGPWQFDADLSLNKYEDKLKGNDYEGDITTLALAVEYLVTQNIYANVGYKNVKDDFNDNVSGNTDIVIKTTQLSLGGGYRTQQYDVSLKYLQNDVEDDPADNSYTYELKGNLITLNGAYFF